MSEADQILGKDKGTELKGPSKKVKAKVDKIWESMNAGTSKMPKFKSLASLQRKGKKRKVSNWKHMLSSKKKTKSTTDIALQAAKKAQKTGTTTSVVKFAGKEMTLTTTKKTATKSNTKKKQIGALDTMLDCIKDPKRINTVEKSSYDWDKYKAENKLDEEFEKQAQNGYVNRKEFLNRVDWRRFASEKEIRDRERAKRMQSEKK
jgi:hypothetical protein